MPLPKSKKNVGLGHAILNKKAKESKERRANGGQALDAPPTNLQSVTQERDLDEFLNTAQLAATDFTAEKQNVRIISAPGVGSSSAANPFLLSAEDESLALHKHSQYKTALRVPRRPAWTKAMTAAEVDKQEREAFLEWRRNLALLQESQDLLFTPFERNIQVWRQLWRVLERSHLVVQIIDARNPLRFRCEDLEAYIADVEGPEGEKGTGKGWRKALLLINKADLLSLEQRRQWADYFEANNVKYAFFSALNAKELQEAAAAAAIASATPLSPSSSASGSHHEDSDEEEETEEEEEEESSEEESEEDIPKAARARAEADASEAVDLDPRTRVLDVTELEDLFVNSAPDLTLFTPPNGTTPKLNVGLVGYPNVGKSSTINALLGAKKVSVSSTPGKTKHFQTIHLSPSIMLCDCPGLVFPQFATSKAALVCDGVLPIDQMREYTAPVELVVRRIRTAVVEAVYGLAIPRKREDEGGDGRIHAEDLLKAYAVARGFTRAGLGMPDEARAARYILKDYVDGRLLFCHPPPNISADDFNAAQQAQALAALEASGKKKAPVTRVGKDAITYVAPSPGADLSAPGVEEPNAGGAVDSEGRPIPRGAPGQSARSKQLDDDFFQDGTGLSDKPFVKGSAVDQHAGFQRVVHYPHQKAVGDDGRAIEGGVRIPIPVGKKHYKGARNVKKRSGRGYD